MTQTESTSTAANPALKASRRRTVKPSCERCYFGRRELCALELGEPCSTFRPDSPEGLFPPTQPTLLVRAEPEPADNRSESVVAA
jgi:hypothetical protein